jgi:hypothetical protein
MQDQSPELVGESRGRHGVVRFEQVPAEGIAVAGYHHSQKINNRYHLKNNNRYQFIKNNKRFKIGGMQKEDCASRRDRGSYFIII